MKIPKFLEQVAQQIKEKEAGTTIVVPASNIENQNLDLVMQDISAKMKLAQQGIEQCVTLKKGTSNGRPLGRAEKGTKS